MVEPVHPPMLVLGGATPIIGLTPALSSSVAPSGMVPPGAAPAPANDGDGSVPLAAEPADTVAQPPDVRPADPIPLIPPPSKVELVPDADIPPEALAMPEDEEPELQVGDTIGLRPPGLISVAPKPMPALDPAIPVEPLDPLIPIVPLAPGMPSGDTDPIAGAVGVVDMVCAATAPQLNKSPTAAADSRRIETPCPLLRRGRPDNDRSATWISIERSRAIKLVVRTLNLNSQSDRMPPLLRIIALACAKLPLLRHSA